MFKEQKFVKSVYSIEDIPKLRLPEIVLCGRSNVGKSSFINSLFNRKDLAKISSTPGKTRSINYYEIDNKFYIVDLPGYGYAKVSVSERKKWAKLILDFFSSSDYINLVIHILDSRHKPTELDVQLNNLLKQLNLPYIFLLNKSDKLKQSEFKQALKGLTELFPEAIYNENTFFYSSLKGTGQKEVKSYLSATFYS
ncbi:MULTISPECIES: ribosome biogenesis GTP-binding protein YihA/YsxC [Ignavibacterium]|jgi:GTP-binding protein|uniref:ribosome biogenesis GTP-binding protein YihA/YsxC n=1 Tax=Ignavibacterium TaxID=795750 RepID=UPI0025BE4F0A|nr:MULTISPECIES: ribosome biogenesis GTP-binding protein YihA/YsxC [Ignavibacterium]MBI5661613.1 YihA family ribosome biogenesis GTP-binding protein [Ignavibacterium album]